MLCPLSATILHRDDDVRPPGTLDATGRLVVASLGAVDDDRVRRSSRRRNT